MAPNTNNTLFGRQTDRARRTIGLAVGLLVCMFLVGAYARGRWMQDVMAQQVYPVLFVILVGGGLATWNAYWNDGLLLNWLVVCSLVTPWLLHFNLQYGIYEPFISAGYVTLALVVGTIGHLVGVGLRSTLREDPDGGDLEKTIGALGSASSESIQWALLVAGLFFGSVVLVYVAEPYRFHLVSVVYPVTWFYPIGVVTWETVIGVGLVLGWLGLATWPAYRGNGLLISWCVILAPISGTILSYSLLEAFFTPDLSGTLTDDVAVALLVAVPIAVILGTSGFLIGVMLHRIGAFRRPDSGGMES